MAGATACLCWRGKLATHAARSGRSNAFASNCSINYSEGEIFLATHARDFTTTSGPNPGMQMMAMMLLRPN